MARTVRELTGENTVAAAWDSLFRYFNQDQGKGSVGYQAGEKVTIKVNMVSWILRGDFRLDENYDIYMGSQGSPDYPSAAPQMMLALLKQLVYVVGADQADIAIGDPTTRFPNQYYDVCHDVFPNVEYLDGLGGIPGHPRTPIANDFSVPIHWSSQPNMTGLTQDYILTCYTEADYIINMASFKSHKWAAVTFCGKNFYGSFIRYPGQAGYYNWHESLPSFNTSATPSPDMGSYRAIVDMLGHPHLGGKTMLFLIDGLYAGKHVEEIVPVKLNSAPFNGDWSSSIFASQDPVAIDSVAYDVLWAEPGWELTVQKAAGDDFLHEAAEANDPASGVFYAPDANYAHPDYLIDRVRLPSLGTHEHWNNATDKQYSRNLGTGDGIELLMFSSASDLGALAGDIDDDNDVDANDLSLLVAHWLGKDTLRPELVVIEAEHYDTNDIGSGTAAGSSWVQLTGAGSMGDGYMQALPDTGLNINDPFIESDSPHLSYQINFNTTAPDVNYYLWVKGDADDPLANCLHYGLDGASVSFDNNSAPQLNQSSGFTWISETKDSSRLFVTIPSAGTHTLEVWMREDGAQIDRLLLTTDVNYDPTGQAPEEGAHQLTNIIGDLNTDDQVNMTDITILAQDWLKGTD